MVDSRVWRSGGSGPLLSVRTVSIFAIFLVAMWAYYDAPVGRANIFGYTLLVGYNTLELLRPAVVDSTVYWRFFPVYLYLLAVVVSWLTSVLYPVAE